MYPEIPHDTARENELCRASFTQHWAEAQIDGPMQTIARYDDVAKLLITIGGFLLAVLAAGYSAMVKDMRPYIGLLWPRIILWVVFGSMLIFFISAAGVCFPQPERMAGRILSLKPDADLSKDIGAWCDDITCVIKIKRGLLISSITCFVISFSGMTWLLLNPLG